MKRLLFVHHTVSPATHALFLAAMEGVNDPALAEVDVTVRPAAFKRCLANLITNAGRFADTIAISGHRDHRWLTVTVDGGLAPSILASPTRLELPPGSAAGAGPLPAFPAWSGGVRVGASGALR